MGKKKVTTRSFSPQYAPSSTEPSVMSVNDTVAVEEPVVEIPVVTTKSYTKKSTTKV